MLFNSVYPCSYIGWTGGRWNLATATECTMQTLYTSNELRLEVKVKSTRQSCHHACHKGIHSNQGTAPLILNFSTSWRCVVCFTVQPLYPQGKSPNYSPTRRLGGTQTQTRHYTEQKNFLPLPGIQPQFLHCPNHGLVTTPTMIS
jgi:hypothetical protein